MREGMHAERNLNAKIKKKILNQITLNKSEHFLKINEPKLEDEI